jgi:hypothetical protein
MHRIIFQQQRQCLGIPQIIDRGDIKPPLILQERAKHIAANPAKPIDPNFNGGHGESPVRQQSTLNRLRRLRQFDNRYFTSPSFLAMASIRSTTRWE